MVLIWAYKQHLAEHTAKRKNDGDGKADDRPW